MASYTFEQKDDQCSVKLLGDLTAGLVPYMQVELKKALDKGTTDLMFDLEKTVMLDSSGMGLLIAASNSMARIGGRMRVTNVSPDILRLLQSMRLSSRLNVSGSAS